MNSNKWRTVELPRQVILDIVEAHLLAMRGMERREIGTMEIDALLPLEFIPIKLKLKEIKPADQSGKQINAQMASKPQEKN